MPRSESRAAVYPAPAQDRQSVIADLPDKTEMKTYCGLTKKQAALYAVRWRNSRAP